jgi:hypothetical protein
MEEALHHISVRPTITPPPRHTSPSYSTALCPGVTAHCASGNSRRKSAPTALTRCRPHPAGGSASWRRTGPARAHGQRTSWHPGHRAGATAARGGRAPAPRAARVFSRSLRATNHGACSPTPRWPRSSAAFSSAPLAFTPPMPRPWRWPRCRSSGPHAGPACGPGRPGWGRARG